LLVRTGAIGLYDLAPFARVPVPSTEVHRVGEGAHGGEHDRHHEHRPRPGGQDRAVVDARQRGADRQAHGGKTHARDKPADGVHVCHQRKRKSAGLQQLRKLRSSSARLAAHPRIELRGFARLRRHQR
jgi:hypothetical protein